MKNIFINKVSRLFYKSRFIIFAFIIPFFFSNYLYSFPSNDSLSLAKNQFEKNLKYLYRYYIKSFPLEEHIRKPLIEMCKGLDPYTRYLPSEKALKVERSLGSSYQGLGFSFYVVGDSVMIVDAPETYPAYKSGLRVGDRLLEIEKKTVVGLSSENISKLIENSSSDSISFLIYRPNIGNLLFHLSKNKIPNQTTYGIIVPNTHIAYLKIKQFAEHTGLEASKKLLHLISMGAQSAIIDLRGNRGGSVRAAIQLADIFLPKGLLICSQRNERGTNIKKQLVKNFYSTKKQLVNELFPLLILIDKSTASASEIFASAMRDLKGVKLYGEQSFGKGVSQAIFSYKDGSKLLITMCKNYPPKSPCIDGIGLKPDSLISYTELPFCIGLRMTDDKIKWNAIKILTDSVSKTTLLNDLPMPFLKGKTPLNAKQKESWVNAFATYYSLIKYCTNTHMQQYFMLYSDPIYRAAINYLDSSYLLPPLLGAIPNNLLFFRQDSIENKNTSFFAYQIQKDIHSIAPIVRKRLHLQNLLLGEQSYNYQHYRGICYSFTLPEKYQDLYPSLETYLPLQIKIISRGKNSTLILIPKLKNLKLENSILQSLEGLQDELFLLLSKIELDCL